MASISHDGIRTKIDGLVVEDQNLIRLLEAHPEDRWDEMVARALGVGASGLLTMGLGVDLAEVDARVRRSLEEMAARSEREVARMLSEARDAFTQHLDPDQRTSLVSKTMREFHALGQGLMDGVDIDKADSHTARFFRRLDELVGPQGLLEQRLHEALDPDTDGSALARLSTVVSQGFTELRDLIVADRARAVEAERGTAKGIDFEDRIEEALRETARGLGGWLVERTSRAPGELGPESLVGDFVLTLPAGHRIVVEAKNTGRIALTGKDGILAELDRAMDNRAADFAICVAARDAYPREVGTFNVYGHRALIVDEGDGTMTSVALRWARAVLEATSASGEGLDPKAVADRLDRVRALAQRLSGTKRTLTEAQTAIDGAKDGLDWIRTELLDFVDGVETDIRKACGPAGGDTGLAGR